MPLDSNRPLQRVHNGGDGIWDGAGWGAVAGAGATALAYGTAVHGAKHLQNLNTVLAGNRQGKLYENNARRAAFGKRHYSEEALQAKALKMENRAAAVNKMLGNMQKTGEFAFGSAKRTAATVTTGLLGGMIAGAITDSID